MKVLRGERLTDLFVSFLTTGILSSVRVSWLKYLTLSAPLGLGQMFSEVKLESQ